MPASALAELDRLVARGVPNARAARDLAGRFAVTASRGGGDAAVEAAAEELGAWVLTADRAFAGRLRRRGVPTVVPRDRQRLHLVPGAPRLPSLEGGRRRPKG